MRAFEAIWDTVSPTTDMMVLILIKGIVQTRSDDLESLGYMMIYFYRGSLPWQGLKARGDSEKDRLVMEMKKSLDEAAICSGLPQEFETYMRHIKSLSCGKKPNYNKLRRMFRELAVREGVQYDNVFDWTERVFSLKEMNTILG